MGVWVTVASEFHRAFYPEARRNERWRRKIHTAGLQPRRANDGGQLLSSLSTGNFVGTNMRGLQEDLKDFQRCVRSSQPQPRPPNKPKSSFYEGPPQRSGTLRERFFKVRVAEFTDGAYAMCSCANRCLGNPAGRSEERYLGLLTMTGECPGTLVESSQRLAHGACLEGTDHGRTNCVFPLANVDELHNRRYWYLVDVTIVRP